MLFFIPETTPAMTLKALNTLDSIINNTKALLETKDPGLALALSGLPTVARQLLEQRLLFLKEKIKTIDSTQSHLIYIIYIPYLYSVLEDLESLAHDYPPSKLRLWFAKSSVTSPQATIQSEKDKLKALAEELNINKLSTALTLLKEFNDLDFSEPDPKTKQDNILINNRIVQKIQELNLLLKSQIAHIKFLADLSPSILLSIIVFPFFGIKIALFSFIGSSLILIYNDFLIALKESIINYFERPNLERIIALYSGIAQTIKTSWSLNNLVKNNFINLERMQIITAGQELLKHQSSIAKNYSKLKKEFCTAYKKTITTAQEEINNTARTITAPYLTIIKKTIKQIIKNPTSALAFTQDSAENPFTLLPYYRPFFTDEATLAKLNPKSWILEHIRSQNFLTKPYSNTMLPAELLPQKIFNEEAYTAPLAIFITALPKEEAAKIKAQLMRLALVLSGDYYFSPAELQQLIIDLSPSKDQEKNTAKILSTLFYNSFKGQGTPPNSNKINAYLTTQESAIKLITKDIENLLSIPEEKQPELSQLGGLPIEEALQLALLAKPEYFKNLIDNYIHNIYKGTHSRLFVLFERFFIHQEAVLSVDNLLQEPSWDLEKFKSSQIYNKYEQLIKIRLTHELANKTECCNYEEEINLSEKDLQIIELLHTDLGHPCIEIPLSQNSLELTHNSIEMLLDPTKRHKIPTLCFSLNYEKLLRRNYTQVAIPKIVELTEEEVDKEEKNNSSSNRKHWLIGLF